MLLLLTYEVGSVILNFYEANFLALRPAWNK